MKNKMSSERVIKAVAKKLYHYLEVHRLENGFDLSGTNLPTRTHPPLRPRPTLQHGLYDRSLHQFMKLPEVRGDINSIDKKCQTEQEREEAIKTLVQHYLARYKFYHPANQQDYAYMPTRHGRKSSDRITGFGFPPSYKKKCVKGGMPVLRSQPPQYISRSEAQRLITVTTKLLAASEDIKTPRSRASSAKSNLPNINEKSCQKPPYIRPKTRRGLQENKDLHVSDETRTSTIKKNSAHLHESADSETDDEELVTRNDRQTQAFDKQKKEQWIYPCPQFIKSSSATSESEEEVEPTSKKQNIPFYIKKKNPQKNGSKQGVIDGQDVASKDKNAVEVMGSTQMVESVAIQTDYRIHDHGDCSEELAVGPTDTEYQVFVRTGVRNGASTKAQVKITLFGENGRSNEIALTDSKRHKICFQKGKEDLFFLHVPYLGKLKKIKIGHDRTDLSYAWYLEGVSVYDMTNRWIYEFICERWLSEQEPDRQTYRHIFVDSQRAMLDDTDSATSSMTAISQLPALAVDPADQSNDIVSTDGTSMHVKVSNGGEANSDELSSKSVTSSSITSNSSKSETSNTDALQDDNPNTVHKTLKSFDVAETNEDDFFDHKDDGPKLTFRSVSSDADTEKPENSKKDTSSSSATPYLDGYKAGLEAANVSQDNDMVGLDHHSVHKEHTIHEAARTGNLARIKEIMHNLPQAAQSRDGAGWTALHIASCEGHESIVKWFLASNMTADDETPAGYTAVHVAAINGHVNILMILCAMGANVNCESIDRHTPLHLAAKHGHLNCVKWLIANEADIYAADNFGRIAVDFSQQYNQNEVTAYLQSCDHQLNVGLSKGRTENTDECDLFIPVLPMSEEACPKENADIHIMEHLHTIEDKRALYNQQKAEMEASGDTFLDNIRQQVQSPAPRMY